MTLDKHSRYQSKDKNLKSIFAILNNTLRVRSGLITHVVRLSGWIKLLKPSFSKEKTLRACSDTGIFRRQSTTKEASWVLSLLCNNFWFARDSSVVVPCALYVMECMQL